MSRKRYALYATFVANIPERELLSAELRELDKGVAALDAAEQKAVVLLIYEHYLTEAKVDTLDAAALAGATLPYGGKESAPKRGGAATARTGVAFEFEALPAALKWVLLKFVRQRADAAPPADVAPHADAAPPADVAPASDSA